MTMVNGDRNGQLLRMKSSGGAGGFGADENLVLSVFDDHWVAVQLNAIARVQSLLRLFVRRKSNETVSLAHFDALDDLPVGVEDRLQMHTGGMRGEIADEQFACGLLGAGRDIDIELL